VKFEAMISNFLEDKVSDMGIPYLYRWIQWVSKPKGVCWKQWEGKRVGVDALSFLYKVRDQNERILYVYSLVQQWRSVGVEPIFVFDGKTPREKKGLSRKKRESTDPIYVSTGDRDGVKQLLYTMGVLAVNAAAEADQVLAFAARQGWISAVVSTDLDYLPRGVGTLVIPTGSAIHEWREISLPQILADADISYQSFVDLCVLMGSDYCPSIPTLSYQSIYWSLRAGKTLEEILEHEGIRTMTLWQKAGSIFRGEGDCWESMLAEKQREKWANGPPPTEPSALSDLLHRISPSHTPELSLETH
jgi:5'-3' exonuclease